MRQAESFFRRNLTSSTPWKMSKYKHLTTQMTIFGAQNRKKISNYALPFGITVQRKLAASRGKSTVLKFKICFQFYLWHQIRQHHTALDSHDLFKTIHSKVRCLFIILQGKRKSQTWDDSWHSKWNHISSDNLPWDHITNTQVLLSKNALILSSKNPAQALLSHQEDFLCQEWWQFPSRARGRNSQACASAMRPSLPMAPWRRQNRTAIPWKVCHYNPASPSSQLFKTCHTTSLIELLTNAEQCLPAASAKMAGYLQELDGQLLSATVRMF